MNSFFTNMEIAREIRTEAHKSAAHYKLVRLALQKKEKKTWSKLLVKLGGMLIEIGGSLKSRAERDLHHTLSIPSLQDL